MPDQKISSLEQLLEIMAKLRDRETGCPWDVEQTFETISPYTLEEAYEVDHAIRTGDMESLCDELGDLLLQVVFHAQMAKEAGRFDFADVAAAICDKLVRRHPHVFVPETGEGVLANFETVEEQTKFWEDAKAKERAEREGGGVPDPFEGIPIALPALARAAKLQKRASRLEFVETWLSPTSDAEVADFDSALERLIASVKSGPEESLANPKRASALIGQLLNRCVVAARALGVDPEDALRAENFEFEVRIKEAAGAEVKS